VKINFATVLKDGKGRALKMADDPGEQGLNDKGEVIWLRLPTLIDMMHGDLAMNALKWRDASQKPTAELRRTNIGLIMKIALSMQQEVDAEIDLQERDRIVTAIGAYPAASDDAFHAADAILNPQPKEVETAKEA
jgi:hypothetical protein